MGLAPPIGDLVGKLQFSDDELQKTQRGLEAAGVELPNFSKMSTHFEVEPEEPEMTEEEMIFYELTELEDEIIELQSLCRGHALRHQLFHNRYVLEKTTDKIIILQSVIRGNKTRKMLLSQKKNIDSIGPILNKLQATIRAGKVRAEIHKTKTKLKRSENLIVELQSAIRAKPIRSFQNKVKFTITEGQEYVALIEFQSIIRGNLVRQNYTQFQQELDHRFDGLSDIQSLIRGKQCRHNLSLLKIELRQHGSAIQALQAKIRGDLARDTFDRNIKNIITSSEWILPFQCAARGYLVRKKFSRLSNKIVQLKLISVELQAGIRGYLLRKDVEKTKLDLIRFKNDFLDVQSAARGLLLRDKLGMQHYGLEQSQKSVVFLQSLIRGNTFRKHHSKMLNKLDGSISDIIELQSIIRGKDIRVPYLEMSEELASCKNESLEMQSIIRGNFVRNALFNDKHALIQEESNIMDLQSIIRAGFVRNDLTEFLDQLDLFTPAVVKLQSIFRGVMIRFNYDLMLEEFDDSVESIVALQAHIRGGKIRTDHKARIEYFKKNMDKVIKIQSFLRAKKEGDSYKSLTSSSNPPLSTVKNFVHLLNDSDLDFEQEVQLEQNRKQVVDEINHNEQLEQFINQLDVKIALLLKNKITIDEVVRHRNGGMNSHLSVTNSNGGFDLKALNKSSRKRLELYQGFFYILQTQPIYFSRLFKQMRATMVTEKETKELESMIKTIFGGAQKRREEFFYLRLVSESIIQEMEDCENVKAVLRGNFIWWKLLGVLNRAPKERKLLRQMLYSSVTAVVGRSDLDLESDPVALYKKSIAEEEMRTGQLSQRNPDVTVNEAISYPDIRAIYISNLQKLRDLTTEFLTTLADNVESLPYHIRFAAREIYNLCKTRYPKEHSDRVLSVVGLVVVIHYINPAIIDADKFSIISSGLGPIQTRNLTEITKVMAQISMLKPFNSNDVFLQRLNSYVEECRPRMREMFTQIIDVPDLGAQYQTSVYDDLTSHMRPVLYLKTSEILTIHSLVSQELDTMAPDSDDPLRMVINQLGTLPTDASEILNIAKFTDVKLELNPSFCTIEDSEAEINSLMVSAKRCLIYVLRVQSGSNLLDVLVSPVEEFHEQKYRTLLAEEAKTREKRQLDSTIIQETQGLGDLESLKYRELKLLALEKIIELESHGKITREDNYQGILNSIAQDIKTKRDRRFIREKELQEVQTALSHLGDKEEYLQKKLKTYNDYIEQAMLTLQTKKGSQKKGLLKEILKPFSKQYFHLRDLQKTGRVPKFGSYKYNATDLFDRGVLVELRDYNIRQYDKVSFTFSSDEVGVFKIEAAYGSVALPGATAELTLDELLSQQYNDRQTIQLFDNLVKFNTNLLLHFIFKKFYRDGQ